MVEKSTRLQPFIRSDTSAHCRATRQVVERNYDQRKYPFPFYVSSLSSSSFAGSEAQNFHIDSRNSKNEVVGTAHFHNPNPDIGSLEKIAWYWSPSCGFKIICTRTDLLNAYEKDQLRTPFQFYRLVINESGIVAGSFLIDQVNDSQGHFNQYPWFWWSINQGLHLSSPPDTDQILRGINDDNYISSKQQRVPESAKSFDIPSHVLTLFRKYKNLEEAVTKKNVQGQMDALTLLTYHLYRPDEKGEICKKAIENRFYTPIELVKICLPCREYLKTHPQVIDQLYTAALHSGKEEIIRFLYDRQKIINCAERDRYFINTRLSS